MRKLQARFSLLAFVLLCLAPILAVGHGFDSEVANQILNSSDPMTILGLNLTDLRAGNKEARDKLIESAYLQRIKEFHPDRYQGTDLAKIAEQVASKVNNARDQLKNRRLEEAKPKPKPRPQPDPSQITPRAQYMADISKIVNSLSRGLNPEQGARQLEAVTTRFRQKHSGIEEYLQNLSMIWNAQRIALEEGNYKYTNTIFDQNILLAIAKFAQNSENLPPRLRLQLGIMAYGHARLSFPYSLKIELKEIEKIVDPIIRPKYGRSWKKAKWQKSFPNAHFAKSSWNCFRFLLDENAERMSHALNAAAFTGLSLVLYFF
ncbi:MAG: hypothetical protein AB7F86_08215 [Bdellovibrionales bacterium]